jgi:hypothetical protein
MPNGLAGKGAHETPGSRSLDPSRRVLLTVLTPAEVAEFNQSVAAIHIPGARLPDAILGFSRVEAPTRP